MTRKIIITFSCIVISLCIEIRADIYSDIIKQIVHSNPELLQLNAEQASVIASLKSDNSLDAIELEFGSLWSNHRNEKKWNIGVSQTFDFPGVYNVRKKYIDIIRESMNLQYKAKMADCIYDAHCLMIKIAYYNRVINLEQAVVTDLKNITEMLESAYDNGQVTLLEVYRSRIELANNTKRLYENLSARQSALSELQIKGCNIDNPNQIEYPVFKLLTREEYLNQLMLDPVIDYYRKIKQAEQVGLKARVLESLPGITVGYVYEYEDKMSFNGFKLGLSLPLYKLKNNKAAAKSKIIAAEWAEISSRIERESFINTIYDETLRSRDLYEMLASVFVKTNSVMLLKKAYDGGELSAIDYLQGISYFRESELEFLKVEYDYNQSLLNLNKLQLLLNQPL